MDKILNIAGKEVGLRATALTPRLYRHKIGRDIIQDMAKLQKAFSKAAQLPQDATEEERQEAQLSVMDLEIFENVAFIMAGSMTRTSLARWTPGWISSTPSPFTRFSRKFCPCGT